MNSHLAVATVVLSQIIVFYICCLFISSRRTSFSPPGRPIFTCCSLWRKSAGIPFWDSSPSAGRFLGYLNTNGFRSFGCPGERVSLAFDYLYEGRLGTFHGQVECPEARCRPKRSGVHCHYSGTVDSRHIRGSNCRLREGTAEPGA